MDKTPALIVTWEEAAVAGAQAVGCKGWNLGRLHRYGFRVPRGGVIVASVYDAVLSLPHIASLRREVDGVSPDRLSDEHVTFHLAHLRDAIATATLPGTFLAELERFLAERGLADALRAVRSSATAEDSRGASFAGMHESFLNVYGLDEIEAAVKACYASLWTPRALAYRRRLGLTDDDVRCAVVLCEMVGTKGPQGAVPMCAGVAFSCDPVTGDRERITISAVSGLGDAVVSGAANPEEIVVHVGSTGEFERVERKSPGATVLTDQMAVHLARQVERVVWALGDGQDPHDVEWAYDGGTLWLLQARPVTKVPRNVPEGAKALPAVWSNGNLKDAVPIVLSTYGWSMMRQIIAVNLFAPHRAAGYAVPPGMELLRRFAGRPYFDLTLMAWIYWDALAGPPADLNRSLGGYQPEIPIPRENALSSNGRRRSAPRMRLWRVLRDFDRRGEEMIRQAFEQVAEWSRMDLTALSDEKLLAHLREVKAAGLAFGPYSMYANASAGVWLDLLERLLEKVAKGRGKAIAAALMAGSGGVVSAEHGFRLYDLARAAQQDEAARVYLQTESFHPQGWRQLPATSPFRMAFEQFLREFGHRAVYEVDVMTPRWNEDPSYLLAQIRAIMAMGEIPDPREEARRRREKAESELASRSRVLRPVIRWLAERLRHSFALREGAKSALVAFLAPTRAALLELGRRLAAAGRLAKADDVFFLSASDVEMLLLGLWDGTGCSNLVADRKEQFAQWLAESPPDVFVTGEGGALQAWSGGPTRGEAAGSPRHRPHAATESNRLTGIAVSPGTARGKVRVLHHPHEGQRLLPGEVLVAPSTDPGWTPLFLRAAAVVMEVGGYQSHGAIVSREYGLPAVVNIPGLLGLLHDGDEVLVDGDAGTVTIVDRAETSEGRRGPGSKRA